MNQIRGALYSNSLVRRCPEATSLARKVDERTGSFVDRARISPHFPLSHGAPPVDTVVKAGPEHRVKRGADYQPGVSAETVGSQVIWLGLMTLPPGARTKAHVHERHETALYMMRGDELELWAGDDLEHCDRIRSGDFAYIPANVLHVAVNRGTTPAVFIGSRNEATAQESLVLHPEMDARVP